MKSYIVTFAFLASLTLANPITQAPAMMPRADNSEGDQLQKRACNSRVTSLPLYGKCKKN
ncbi:hypothetical protein Neosp_001808 [[Neocosmospora] mangrovei]